MGEGGLKRVGVRGWRGSEEGGLERTDVKGYVRIYVGRYMRDCDMSVGGGSVNKSDSIINVGTDKLTDYRT